MLVRISSYIIPLLSVIYMKVLQKYVVFRTLGRARRLDRTETWLFQLGGIRGWVFRVGEPERVFDGRGILVYTTSSEVKVVEDG